MNSLFELGESISNVSKHLKTKVNIHFSVEEPLLSACVVANNYIDRIGENDILFDNRSICVPHISLVMGYIYHVNDLGKIFNQLSEYVEQLTPFEYRPSSINLKSVSDRAPKYVFINSTQDDDISQKRDEVYNLLSNTIEPLEWDYRDESPHITLARCKNPDSILNDYLNDLVINLPSFEIKHIGVSFAGTRGVCLGNLKSFPLGKKMTRPVSNLD